MDDNVTMKNRNLTDSFNNAINGIAYTIRTERNMKIHMVAAIAVLILSLFFKLTRAEFLVICITVAVVIICELFNTAVEVLVDIIVDVYHPKAGIVKDVAAGAVLVSAFLALIVGYFIFFDRVSTEIATGITKIKQSPMHVTIIALVITIVLVLSAKAFLKKGTPFKGGMPSGHSAIGFAVTTAILLWTGNVKVAALSFIVWLLLVQSRLEAKIHSILELLAGAVLGFLVTLLLFQVFYL